MAWATKVANKNNYRLRVFGLHNINETVTGAFLVTATAIITELKISPAGVNYIVGDVRFNATVWGWLIREMVGITITSKSFPAGTIGGYLVSRPHLAFALASSDQVLPPSNASSGGGLGFGYVGWSATSLPTDLLLQNQAVLNSLFFYGRADYFPIKNITSVTYNAPAARNQVGPVVAKYQVALTDNAIALIQATSTVPLNPGFFDMDNGMAYMQINTQLFPNGLVRGNFLPVVSPGHRQLPYAVTTTFGTTDTSSGLSTLRHPNQFGKKNNPNSYITLQAMQTTPGTGAFNYQGLFSFQAGATKANFALIRGYQLELNMRSQGSGTWLFEWFNANNGTFMSAGTFSGGNHEWNAAFSLYFDATSAWMLPTNRGVLTVRVSTSNATPTTLLLDLFAVRAYTPSSGANQLIKMVVKQLPSLPTQ